MELKIKEEYKDVEIWVSFTNQNIIAKFIDAGLYPHLYKSYPHIFEEVIEEEVKTKKTKVNDLFINNPITEGNNPE